MQSTSQNDNYLNFYCNWDLRAPANTGLYKDCGTIDITSLTSGSFMNFYGTTPANGATLNSGPSANANASCPNQAGSKFSLGQDVTTGIAQTDYNKYVSCYNWRTDKDSSTLVKAFKAGHTITFKAGFNVWNTSQASGSAPASTGSVMADWTDFTVVDGAMALAASAASVYAVASLLY